MDTITKICRLSAEWTAFFADLVTLLLGALALWAIIFHRQKLELFFRVVLNSFVNERIKRIKETLGKLEGLNYDNKNDRPEIVALLGQVLGQIKPLINTDAIKQVHVEMTELLQKKTRLSEATKRRLAYELHAGLDGLSFAAMQSMLEENK